MDAMRNDPLALTIGSMRFQVQARYDAPPKVRKACWVLSQLRALVFPRLPRVPKPHLQVDSAAFAFLLEQDARVLIFSEVLIADDLNDPIIINLGPNFAQSCVEVDLGRDFANQVVTEVNARDE
jgi:hypothetical protein